MTHEMFTEQLRRRAVEIVIDAHLDEPWPTSVEMLKDLHEHLLNGAEDIDLTDLANFLGESDELEAVIGSSVVTELGGSIQTHVPDVGVRLSASGTQIAKAIRDKN